MESLRPPQETLATSLPLPDPEAYAGEPREYAKALMDRKDQIDREIHTLEELQRSHGVSSATRLFDPEGYPRGDIDVYSIRHARAALARLQTDRKTVSDLLATALHGAFARDPNAPPSSGPSASASTSTSRQTNGHAPSIPSSAQLEDDMPDEWPSAPIARVNTVAAGSPAESADMRAGDTIFSFGGVTVASAGGLQAVGGLVSRSEGATHYLDYSVIREWAR